MTTYSIHRDLICLKESEFNRILSDLEAFKKSNVLSKQRVKLLEEQLRATENELKQERAKTAANELTAESQRLGMYDSAEQLRNRLGYTELTEEQKQTNLENNLPNG